MTKPKDSVAVIFVNRRSAQDDDGYRAAAEAMDALAAAQPGYLGIDSVRDADGHGITISYWADEASARGWRANVEHGAAIAQGKSGWYDSYQVIVTAVTRSYDWVREGLPDR